MTFPTFEKICVKEMPQTDGSVQEKDICADIKAELDAPVAAPQISFHFPSEISDQVSTHSTTEGEPVADSDRVQRSLDVICKDAPTVMTWKSMKVETRKGKVLLNNVSGAITGGFWAIMGASGGGKTTLLSALSLRLDSSRMNITGEIRLNGREYSKSNLKAMSAYVMQDDLLHPELTVGETISYAAQLRSAGKLNREEQKIREQEVMELMGITHVKDVMIGDSENKGISGGERKRVCVAIELISRPILLFLDEPTSGLDSTTALSVCKALCDLTRKGVCTVVCTIHQPQVKIFEMFDSLILMKKGEIAYQGCRKQCLRYLENAGLPCPPATNPADYLVAVVCPNRQEHTFEEHENQELPIDLSLGLDKSFFSTKSVAVANWWKQFFALMSRCSRQYLRKKKNILMTLFVTITLALFVSLGIWHKIGENQASIPKRVPSLFFVCVSQGILSSLQCISSFPRERAIILRERAAGSYFVSAYFVAKTVSDTLTQIWSPVLFAIIVYPLIGLQASTSKFFIYMMFLILDSMAALSLATMVSAICVSLEASTIVLSLLLELSRLYGGFFTSPAQLEHYSGWKFMDALSYLKYAFVGVALNELEGLELKCTDREIERGSCISNGAEIIVDKGYQQYSITFCAGMLVVYIVVARLIAFLALRFFKR